MGVYIKGMEMPTSCLNCFLSRSGCRAVLKRMRAMEAGTWIPANYRHDDCPLVPVPPHGRTIDADAFLELCNAYAVTPSDDEFCKRLEYALTRAATIIPTEDGEI